MFDGVGVIILLLAGNRYRAAFAVVIGPIKDRLCLCNLRLEGGCVCERTERIGGVLEDDRRLGVGGGFGCLELGLEIVELLEGFALLGGELVDALLNLCRSFGLFGLVFLVGPLAFLVGWLGVGLVGFFFGVPGFFGGWLGVWLLVGCVGSAGFCCVWLGCRGGRLGELDAEMFGDVCEVDVGDVRTVILHLVCGVCCHG